MIKRTNSDLEKEVARMVKEGTMPSLDEVLKAVGDTRAKYQDAILDARKDSEADTTEE